MEHIPLPSQEKNLSQVKSIYFLRNYNKYVIYKDVIYKIKLNRNIPSLSSMLRLKTNKAVVAEREHS